MWQIFKDSLINPKGISDHIDYKHKFLYLLMLCILLCAPVIADYAINGIIPQTTFGSMTNTIESSVIDYKLEDGILNPVTVDTKDIYLYNDNVCMFFMNKEYTVDEDVIVNVLNGFDNIYVTQLNLIFTKQGVKLFVYMSGYYHIFDLGTYSEFTANNIDFTNSSNSEELLKISKLITGIYDKYKNTLLLVIIPVQIVIQLISLMISILIPCVILLLFNRGRIKFKEIFGLGIFAYTPYVILSLLGTFVSSIFSYVGEFVSLLYLFIAFYGFLRNGHNIDDNRGE